MTANGIMHCVLETAKATLGKCKAWQTWPGVGGNEAAALARIYIDALPVPAGGADAHTLDELKAYRPYIILTDGTDGGFTMMKHAVGGDVANPGLAELAETPGMLAINRVEVIGPARTAEEDISALGDALRAWLEIHWGHVQ
jgi:hypothetical protein